MNTSRRQFLKNSMAMAAGVMIAPAAYARIKEKHPVCVFTKTLQYLEYEALAATLGEAGYTGADISVRPGGHVEPDKIKTDLPRLVKILAAQGIQTPMMVTAIIDADEPYTEQVIATAAESGLKYYRMGYYDYDRKKSLMENLDIYKRRFDKLEKLNRKYGIHGEYQNHAGIRVGGPVWDLYHLVKDFDPAYIGIQYDIRHAVCEGGESWSLGMELLAPWMKTFPLKDFLWNQQDGKWRPDNRPLGDGMVNFDSYFRKYKELNLDGPFSIHLEYDLGGAESGSRTPSLPHNEIVRYLKKDIQWLRNKLSAFNLD